MDLPAARKSLMPKLKENQNETVSVINFELGKFWKTDGVLSDMGMRDLILSTGKNSTLNDRLPYNKIIHIFDKDCNDIISI
jgi:hypothetical protein